MEAGLSEFSPSVEPMGRQGKARKGQRPEKGKAYCVCRKDTYTSARAHMYVCAHIHARTRSCSPHAQASPGRYSYGKHSSICSTGQNTAPPLTTKTAEPLSPSPGSGVGAPVLPSAHSPLNRPGITVLLHYPPPNPNLDHQPPLMGPAGAFHFSQEHLGGNRRRG